MKRGIPKPEKGRKDDNEKNRCILVLFNLVQVFTDQMRSVGFYFLKRLTTFEN